MTSFQQKYIFYYGKPDILTPTPLNLEKDYTLKIWNPKISEVTPKGLFSPAFFSWGIFHLLGFFHSSEYKVFLIYYKDREIANYTVVQPKYFRSAFMNRNDLQIGPVGTAENHQRKGLAFYTIQKILEFYKGQNIKFWYVARAENQPSLRLIEKIGFTKYGEGTKKKRFGFGFFDRFIIEKKF